MGDKTYERPQAIIYEIVTEGGIAESYGRKGAAGEDLYIDDMDLNW